jgi:hypothetical protein
VKGLPRPHLWFCGRRRLGVLDGDEPRLRRAYDERQKAREDDGHSHHHDSGAEDCGEREDYVSAELAVLVVH